MTKFTIRLLVSLVVLGLLYLYMRRLPKVQPLRPGEPMPTPAPGQRARFILAGLLSLIVGLLTGWIFVAAFGLPEQPKDGLVLVPEPAAAWLGALFGFLGMGRDAPSYCQSYSG